MDVRTQKINIRPEVNILSTLQHLNYKPWFALAEYVDNSIQSMSKHLVALKKLEGPDYKLRVNIDLDSTKPTRISIRDNAAGIFESEVERAFRPAMPPPDRKGLAEFGMGMKSASCWFAPRWSVRTSALGEPVQRRVDFNITKIIETGEDELKVAFMLEKEDAHYTEIVLENATHFPVKRTMGKIKEHLADIYREFIRKGQLELKVNGEPLSYEEPLHLTAPYYRDENGGPREWCKEIKFDFGNGLSVRGFAALFDKANTSKAGFALFRRRRVIQGSGDNGYRPEQIFGKSNSFTYQRLYGELHLEGFDVSHTKDGFQWGDNEQAFLDLLEEHLNSSELPLLDQAQGHRKRRSQKEESQDAEKALENTTRVMEERVPYAVEKLDGMPAVGTPSDDPNPVKPNDQLRPYSRQFTARIQDCHWTVKVELTTDQSESQWLALVDTQEQIDNYQERMITIRVSLNHPFMVRYAQQESEGLEALLRLAAAVAVAEAVAKDSGVPEAGTVRRNLNELLLDAFSKP